jgi:pterin-4a-carbinolamine dehydratase
MNTQSAVAAKSPQYPPGPAGEAPAAGSAAPPGEPQPAETKLKSERVQEELKAMTGWKLAHEEKAIDRVRVFPTSEVAALYGAFVSRFASAAGFSVTVSLSGGQVGLTVYAPQLNGCPAELTESVLAFARQIG